MFKMYGSFKISILKDSLSVWYSHDKASIIILLMNFSSVIFKM